MKKKVIVFKNKNGKYKVPMFIRFKIKNNTVFKFEFEGKLYDKELKLNKEIRQISLLTEALNIKDKKKRLEFVYDKSCELLDDDFYGKNLCEFCDNKCMHDRKYNASVDGCCKSNDGLKKCKYLGDHRCTINCLACKFHICSLLKKKGYKYKINDIYLLKYLYNWKQKIMVYLNFFMTKEETLKDVYKNSLILWTFSKKEEKFIENKE